MICKYKGCIALTSFDLPNSLKTIPENLFYHCSSLTSVKIPVGVKTIEEYAFARCTSLKSIILPVGVEYIACTAFQDSKLELLEIPSSTNFDRDGSGVLYGIDVDKLICKGIDVKDFSNATRIDYLYVQDEVYEEYESYTVIIFDESLLEPRETPEELWQNQEYDKVEYDAGYYERSLEDYEFDRTFLLPEPAVQDGLERVHGSDQGYAGQIFRMGGVAEERRYRVEEAEDGRQEDDRRDHDHLEGGGEYVFGILTLFAGKAEESCLHSECQQCQKQSRPGIQVGNNAVAPAFGRYLI